uniref:HIT-type domain-containing protein n=1 Tax=Romanomermis culicivorax TaxID=13658 RepID=A0A915IP91_ROMCU
MEPDRNDFQPSTSTRKEDVAPGKIKCYFCGKYQFLLNTCPKCNVSYCSRECYADKRHDQCSEAFYRECVVDELRAKKECVENKRKFIDNLKRQMNENVEHFNNVGQGDDSSDSDDEIDSDIYDQIVKGDLDVDEKDLDEELKKSGIGLNTENLLQLLSDKQKRRFHEFLTQNGAQQVRAEPDAYPSHSHLLSKSDEENRDIGGVVIRENDDF